MYEGRGAGRGARDSRGGFRGAIPGPAAAEPPPRPRSPIASQTELPRPCCGAAPAPPGPVRTVQLGGASDRPRAVPCRAPGQGGLGEGALAWESGDEASNRWPLSPCFLNSDSGVSKPRPDLTGRTWKTKEGTWRECALSTGRKLLETAYIPWLVPVPLRPLLPSSHTLTFLPSFYIYKNPCDLIGPTRYREGTSGWGGHKGVGEWENILIELGHCPRVQEDEDKCKAFQELQ
ncbi:uncharacterized protein LOC130706302 [Balaenoptera acutorostrata]|uniref:Uncharacterized protein LOC130706302 n=1 Tax=Balaenoptera acutorostrata TaxID=9767 RepID=A0ABM3SUZ3_BALAC|nr:uncharacterized protein LOC130706302 [Balaenoptera acutorostrata]